MDQKYSPEELIHKYNEGTCTEDERALIESWHLHDLSQSSFEPSQETIQNVNTRTRQAIMAHARADRPVRRLWPQRMIAAASILFFLALGAYFFYNKSGSAALTADPVADVAPGGNKAVLTLGNGQRIILNGAKNGKLALQGNISIDKTTDGNVTYRPHNTQQASNSSEIIYNTMSTPIGGQYELTLADGTKVWLNAASSIKYPTTFSGNERKVEITGEVYFEVAHNAAMPFRVVSDQQVVEVLGTHFNINAYHDEENIRTTLLEGSVKVSAEKNTMIIKPGQQAVLKAGELARREADVNEAVAWKNGYFLFNDEKISSIMRKLSRWYDIDVRYQGSPTNEGFNGAISRFKNISQVLKMLEKTKAVHFKTEGRRVTIIQ